MIQAHQGEVRLSHTFDAITTYLQKADKVNLATSVGTKFTATCSITRDNRPVIRIFQKGIEYARIYKCCWGHYYNCNRTRIGMYANAIDDAL